MNSSQYKTKPGSKIRTVGVVVFVVLVTQRPRHGETTCQIRYTTKLWSEAYAIIRRYMLDAKTLDVHIYTKEA